MKIRRLYSRVKNAMYFYKKGYSLKAALRLSGFVL